MELNKKLAEWAGFKHKVNDAGYEDWYDKDTLFRHSPPNFTESLDACFKWLVPKVKYCCLTKPEHPGFNGMWLCEVRLGVERGHGEDKTPSLALCLAVEKLI